MVAVSGGGGEAHAAVKNIVTSRTIKKLECLKSMDPP
jgi:hypothetical protein